MEKGFYSALQNQNKPNTTEIGNIIIYKAVIIYIIVIT